MAIRSDGTLWSWGNNDWGQLGIGSFGNMASWPVQVGAATTWKQVECGWNFAVAVKTDGTIWAWGENTSGQLGLGNTTMQTSPVQIGTATNWSKVSCGQNYAIAIKTTGTMWSWGNGGNGQLGQGSWSNQSSPVQIGTATDWSDISCGEYSALAIKTTGTLWGWGANTYGQLGTNDVTWWWTPTQAGTATNWKQVSAGYNSSAGIKTNGTLWTWGDNTYGQLGNGTTTGVLAPTQIGTGTTWNYVSAASFATYASKTDNSLWDCGKNTTGQMGYGNSTIAMYTTFAQVSGVTILPGANGLCQVTADSSFVYINNSGSSFCSAGRDYNGEFAQGKFGAGAIESSFNCSINLAANCSSYPVAPSSTSVITNWINTSGTNSTLDYVYTGCYSMAKLVSSGTSKVNNKVDVRLWVEASVPYFKGEPYLARHFQISPWYNASTSTGTVTLYCSQAEFTAYNAAKPASYPKMPTNTTDMANASNILVTKISGSSSDNSGLPGTYTAGTALVISPSSVVYNSTHTRWEISFPVGSFSGFFLHTKPIMTPLAVTETILSGYINNNCQAKLQWKKNGENFSRFILEQSDDGNTWQTLKEMENDLETGNQFLYTGESIIKEVAYYRVLEVENTGKKSYSNVISLKSNCGRVDIKVRPSITTSDVELLLPPGYDRAKINVLNITGQVQHITMQEAGANRKLQLNNLPAGPYIIRIVNPDNGSCKYIRIVKQ